ncbi:MAG TPA: hypothetical protein VFR23_15060 [Jiangellaceae bacterium]|nr:hypothetical protein [Jiangellaceae bacterium]
MRHPMPYGDLDRMRVQRFATVADIDEASVHRGARGVRGAGVDGDGDVRGRRLPRESAFLRVSRQGCYDHFRPDADFR